MKLVLFFIFLSFFTLKAQTNNTITIYFNINSSKIETENNKELDSILLHYLDRINIIKISAYCDTSGSTVYNSRLAHKRAKSTLEFLKINGYNEPISVSALGEEYPEQMVNIANQKLMRKVVIEYTFLKVSDESNSTTIDSNTAENTQNSVFDNLTIEQALLNASEAIVLDIQFYPGEDILIGNSYTELDKLFHFIRRNDSIKTFIRGHVCCGSDMYLSYARAYVVYNYLIQRGISPKRLDVKGFDNTIPKVSPELSDEDRQKNRRVDVIFSLPQQ